MKTEREKEMRNTQRLRHWIHRYGDFGVIAAAIALVVLSLMRNPHARVKGMAISCLLLAGFLWLPQSTSHSALPTPPSSSSARSAFVNLIEAVQEGNLTRTQAALLSGADINSRDADGQTALLYASGVFVHPDLVGFLLQQGANANGADTDGTTPLMEAARVGNVRVATLLLEAGAEIEAENSQGGTALFFAAYKGHSRVVKLLLANGANVNAKNRAGETIRDIILKLEMVCDGNLHSCRYDPLPSKSMQFLSLTYQRAMSMRKLLEKAGAK